MKLVEIYKFVLKEQREIIEFPNSNFIITAYIDEKKLIFSPQQHTSIPTEIRDYVKMLEEQFLILSVKDLGQGAFEVKIDAREDFGAVVDFLKTQSERDRE